MTYPHVANPRKQRGVRKLRTPRCSRATVLAVVLATGCVQHTDALEFQIADAQGVVLYSYPIEPGELVTMEHVHSVHKRPVREVFSVSPDGQLTMEEMIFDRMGANLPFGPETVNGVTTTFIEEDGHYRVVHHSRPLGVVELITGGPAVNHILTMPDGTVVRLLDLTRPQARVALRTHGSA
ncbi:DUF1850 domain-containing protein [Hoyosella sp. YIM 151337]|uniref:DUF1850 domain-containing protein n=1 Tax=Hoyosella sp. YIM 151337 TaxID=2992742 RepID=UPI002236A251|nr:DUF1850 domain-containing protein [Hoyosella sp. YIM 151337]MCW4353825.1 DUF1850 domain-containing protein [Hoyosella sp. YIM 151337]